MHKSTLPRRSRRPAALGRRLTSRTSSRTLADRQIRQRPDRHRHGPLLRDGPRQALGPQREGDRALVLGRASMRHPQPTPSGAYAHGETTSSSADHHRQPRRRSATAIRASTPTSGLTAPARSPGPSRRSRFHGLRTRVPHGPRHFVTFTAYESDLPVGVAFAPTMVETPSRRRRRRVRQFHVAETEKYAHVTYFFNGGREAPFPGGPHPGPEPQGGDLRSRSRR